MKVGNRTSDYKPCVQRQTDCARVLRTVLSSSVTNYLIRFRAKETSRPDVNVTALCNKYPPQTSFSLKLRFLMGMLPSLRTGHGGLCSIWKKFRMGNSVFFLSCK